MEYSVPVATDPVSNPPAPEDAIRRDWETEVSSMAFPLESLSVILSHVIVTAELVLVPPHVAAKFRVGPSWVERG
jgi:hypothetical protein